MVLFIFILNAYLTCVYTFNVRENNFVSHICGSQNILIPQSLLFSVKNLFSLFH